MIDMLTCLRDRWKGHICFAGQPADDELLRYAQQKGVSERIVAVSNPSHEILRDLYSKCEALIFPSWSEGFGWPVIEAQACGAPVISSNIPPMPEVGGTGALYADPNSPESFAEAFLSILEPDRRQSLIDKGFINSERFGLTEMTQKYVSLIEA